MRSPSRIVLTCLAVGGALVVVTRPVTGLPGELRPEADPPAEAPTRPSYTKDGLLEAPRSFRSWVFVGSNLSIQYREEKADQPAQKASNPTEKKDAAQTSPDAFHNVYINPESYSEFRASGRFPDPTILMMEVFQAEERDSKNVIAAGKYSGRRIELAAAVKDSKRPGGGVPWAYYTFDRQGENGRLSPARPFPNAQCYDCHLKHGSIDNVWVQFYPVLRDPE